MGVFGMELEMGEVEKILFYSGNLAVYKKRRARLDECVNRGHLELN